MRFVLSSIGDGILILSLTLFVRRRGLDKTYNAEEEVEKEDLGVLVGFASFDGVGEIPIRCPEGIRNASVVLKTLQNDAKVN
jgi:hypothetical protein